MKERDVKAVEALLKKGDGPMSNAEIKLVRRALRELAARGLVGRPIKKLADKRQSAKNSDDLDCVEFGVIDGIGRIAK